MSPWRVYADPPQSDPGPTGRERRERARARRDDVGFVDALNSSSSGYVVWMCADSLGVVAGPAGPLIDARDVDDALPGPWEADLLSLARTQGVAGRAAQAMAEGYQQAVASIAAEPLHGSRAAALRRSMRLGRSLDPAAAASPDVAVRRLVSPGARLRRDRVSKRWASDAVPADDLGPELAQYRESLPEASSRLLSQYRVADALADRQGRVLVLLSRGGDGDDVLLVEGTPASPSTREEDFGAWRDGSDVQRVLLARETVPLVAAEFAGWSTSVDGATARVWSRARAAKSLPDWGSRRSRAGTLGAALGLLHAASGDAASLAGYLGHSARFPVAVRSVLAHD